MRQRTFAFACLAQLALVPWLALSQQFHAPAVSKQATVEIVLAPAPSGYTIDKLAVLKACAVQASPFRALAAPPSLLTVPQVVDLDTNKTFTLGDHVCLEETYAPVSASAAAIAPTFSDLILVLGATAKGYDDPCQYAFNDCDFHVLVVAGAEQSDLSSQTSQTNGFVDLIARAPTNARFGALSVQARFLGAPTTSNTQNVVSAATDPSGTITSSSLSTVGQAIDYVVTFDHQFHQASRDNPGSGQWTLGPMIGFGATTPLSSQSATLGFAVPAYGTNECTQLINRFQKNPSSSNPGQTGGYNPPLPGSGYTTTTTTGSGAPVPGPMDCVVQPLSSPTTVTATANGVTTTTATVGTQITNIAFSPVDRASFLLKYAAGMRFVYRQHTGSTQRCSSRAANDHEYDALSNGPCLRNIVDIVVGQDEAITGGYLRRAVFKSDVILPIAQSGVYFFGTASIRFRQNQNLPPLILASTPISSGAAGTAGTVTVPSPSVFVLPLKQSDRDFYRIGIAIDLARVFPKLFAQP